MTHLVPYLLLRLLHNYNDWYVLASVVLYALSKPRNLAAPFRGLRETINKGILFFIFLLDVRFQGPLSNASFKRLLDFLSEKYNYYV